MKTDITRLSLTAVLLYFVAINDNWATFLCLTIIYVRSEWYTFSYVFSPKKRKARDFLDKVFPKL